MGDNHTKALFEEVQSIKTLMVLQLMAIGYKQKHIAAALKISEATLSRMLPKGISKDIPKVGTKGRKGD